LEKFPGAIFAIAGEGYLLGSLLKKTRELGITKSVHFLGIRNDVPELLIASDVFALPSLWEGMPIAMLEAMAYGTPVIATQVEGVEDVIKNEINGLAIPPKDTVALAKGILRLLENPDEAARFGNAGKKLIGSRHSVDYMCAEYEELFLKYLNQAAA
jgi:glycosyltransferase involved in cell wall biosynthesis